MKNINIIESDIVPDGEIWLINPILMHYLIEEYNRTHELKIDGKWTSEGYQAIARMVPKEDTPEKADA